jgi:UDP-N-acetylglucosamine-lysosomal-enzyme
MKTLPYVHLIVLTDSIYFLHSLGNLSARELRTLAARIYPLPLDRTVLKKLEKALINCSLSMVMTPPRFEENNSKSALPVVTESLLSACDEIINLLNDSKKTTKKYKHETLGDDDIAFKMISNNATAVLRQLDNIRANKKKFICLNDNIDHSQDATIVRALLVDFYESFFPTPSQFELPSDYRNRYLYIDELRDWKKQREEKDTRNKIAMAVVGLVVLLVLFRRKIVGLVRYFSPFRRRFIPNVSESGSTRLLTV